MELQNLAQSRDVPFVSTHAMLGETSFGLRPKANVLNGIHYSTKGVKLLANEIKRSLYGHNVRFRSQQHPQPYVYNNERVWQGNANDGRDPITSNCNGQMQELRHIRSMAMSFLPHA